MVVAQLRGITFEFLEGCWRPTWNAFWDESLLGAIEDDVTEALGFGRGLAAQDAYLRALPIERERIFGRLK
jgi:hypothetical protein